MPPERMPQPLSAPQKGHERQNGSKGRSAKRKNAQVVCIDAASDMVWRRPEYPILSAGRYTVRGVDVQGPQWLRNYRRWSLRLEFALVTEPVSVSAFFNLGNDPSGQRIRRQSRYYKAWVLANGGHPQKGQKMSPDVFLEGQFFEVEVESCNVGPDGEPKPKAEHYSRITEIIAARGP